MKASPEPPERLLIAEVGSVHDGSFGNALKLVEAAANSGADVVKFQTHIPEAETLPDAPMPPYFEGEPRFDYFKRTGFSREQWKKLKNHCTECGVLFLSSPFSTEAVELLEELDVNLYKVASGETTNVPLLRRLAETGRPVLLSTGMSNWQEIDRAVEALSSGGPLTVMQCSSAYPCPPHQVGLNVIGEMSERYPEARIGYSDHTMGTAAPFAAAALGADVIEKHFTFSRLMYGSDAANSMEPDEFRKLAEGLQEIWTMRDRPVDKNDLGPYRQMKEVFEKSVVAVRDLPAGHTIRREDLAVKKPGNGIPAARIDEVVGCRVTADIDGNTLISFENLTRE